MQFLDDEIVAFDFPGHLRFQIATRRQRVEAQHFEQLLTIRVAVSLPLGGIGQRGDGARGDQFCFGTKIIRAAHIRGIRGQSWTAKKQQKITRFHMLRPFSMKSTIALGKLYFQTPNLRNASVASSAQLRLAAGLAGLGWGMAPSLMMPEARVCSARLRAKPPMPM